QASTINPHFNTQLRHIIFMKKIDTEFKKDLTMVLLCFVLFFFQKLLPVPAHMKHTQDQVQKGIIK
ncbi:hypothetical protein, partial [Alteromonas stellipolaris]|uniref:hypothetical protein n=1 Tax=Alteromonas stellipolaris TaxID=233316 RepID=UPI001D5AA472